MAKWNLFRQLKDLLEAIAPKIFLEGLSPKLEKEPEETELGVLTDVLAKFNPTTTDMRTAVPDDVRQKLHAYLKRAVEQAADPKGVKASASRCSTGTGGRTEGHSRSSPVDRSRLDPIPRNAGGLDER
jgi:hypothetical protein